MKSVLPIALALALAGVALPVAAAPLQAVASFSIIGDMVRQVGGDRVDRRHHRRPECRHARL